MNTSNILSFIRGYKITCNRYLYKTKKLYYITKKNFRDKKRGKPQQNKINLIFK